MPIAEELTELIRIRGARTHNLKNVDVDIPIGKLVVVTGVSGSGKSTLAFDTLFAEGQRRYLESVAVHTRALLRQMPRAEVDEVTGLPPTVSVDQRANAAPVRSTLATVTEIHDFLRLLYTRAGTAHCTECGKPVVSQSIDRIVEQGLQLPDRTKLMVLAPLVRDSRGAHKDVLDRISRHGFVRARVDDELMDVSEVPELSANHKYTIEAVVDRLIIKDGIDARLRESIDLAVRESDGTCILCRQVDGQWQDEFFSTRFSCPDCNLSFQSPTPAIFSFNSALGACRNCEGLGIRGHVDETSDVTVFRTAPCDVCEGSRLQPFPSRFTFLAITIGAFSAMRVDQARQLVASWQEQVDSELKPETTNDHRLTQQARLVAARTLPDIHDRLCRLEDVGLEYLTLDRPARTLSGGEYQRSRLAACLGSGLYGACFVLDEPTAGLHPRDTHRLLKTLLNMRDEGATVVVVEHDEEIMHAADHLIDLGPGAGADGGELLYSGHPSEIPKDLDTPTARFVKAAGFPSQVVKAAIDNSAYVTSCSQSRRSKTDGNQATSHHDQLQLFDNASTDEEVPTITIREAGQNNLQDVTVSIPLNHLVCVTGVSGSGKSTLIMDTLLPVAMAACFGQDTTTAAADSQCASVDGLDQLQRVVAIDGRPLSRNRRSCVATHSKLWNQIRRLFAQTRQARQAGFKSGRFSFNSGDGRCTECKGTGVQDITMKFLPDATVPCAACRGNRFNQATLAVRFKGKSVADVLDMRIDQAIEFFGEFSAISSVLQVFHDVGLGYLALGQPSSTFSGGESQRVRLATELSTAKLQPKLFVIDEPTTGLHPADVERLNRLLRGLVDKGHSIVVIEHNLHVMKNSDWIIDLGPDCAENGGRIVFTGPPAELLKSGTGFTAQAFRTGNSCG